jgi:hypothetical protein
MHIRVWTFVWERYSELTHVKYFWKMSHLCQAPLSHALVPEDDDKLCSAADPTPGVLRRVHAPHVGVLEALDPMRDQIAYVSDGTVPL